MDPPALRGLPPQIPEKGGGRGWQGEALCEWTGATRGMPAGIRAGVGHGAGRTSEVAPEAVRQRRFEEVAKAVGGGYCRLQMPLKLARGVKGAVAGHQQPWGWGCATPSARPSGGH